MIRYFVKPQHRGDLASCAIIFPLFAVLSLSLPLFGLMAWKTVVPPDASGWLLGAPFWLWMVWVMVQWFELVGLVRAEPRRTNSVAVFHIIQGVFVGGTLLSLLTGEQRGMENLTAVILISAEVPTIIFLINYLLLACWTRTRPSWHAASALALGIGSLAYEIWSSNQPKSH